MVQQAEAAGISSSFPSGNPWCEQLCLFPVEDKAHISNMKWKCVSANLKRKPVKAWSIFFFCIFSDHQNEMHTVKTQHLQGFPQRKTPVVPELTFYVFMLHSFITRRCLNRVYTVLEQIFLWSTWHNKTPIIFQSFSISTQINSKISLLRTIHSFKTKQSYESNRKAYMPKIVVF